MTKASVESAVQDEMCCPTCKARQAWSDECRRCKCDLSLLRQYRQVCEAQRYRCLWELCAGRPKRALRHAKRYAKMVGADEAARFLAVCHLRRRDWPKAIAVASRAPNRSDNG